MKKSALFLVLALSSLLTVSCGSDDDDDGTRIEREEAEKDLFSVWREVRGSEFGVLDFRAFTFNREETVEVETEEGANCICSLEFNGNQRNGDILVRNCSGDIQCLELIDTYSYEKSLDTLLICDSRRDCDSYQ